MSATQTVLPFATTAAMSFMLAGNAYMTAESEKTGAHYTFRVTRVKPNADDTRPRRWFVSVLTGPDNTKDYTYLGIISPSEFGLGPLTYRHGIKSRIQSDAPSAVAVKWVISLLLRNRPTPQCTVHHEGRCGRCGRTLTVPESIISGYGPECIQHVKRYEQHR